MLDSYWLKGVLMFFNNCTVEVVPVLTTLQFYITLQIYLESLDSHTHREQHKKANKENFEEVKQLNEGKMIKQGHQRRFISLCQFISVFLKTFKHLQKHWPSK